MAEKVIAVVLLIIIIVYSFFRMRPHTADRIPLADWCWWTGFGLAWNIARRITDARPWQWIIVVTVGPLIFAVLLLLAALLMTAIVYCLRLGQW